MKTAKSLLSDSSARAFLGAQALSYSASAAVPIVISFALLDTHRSALVVGKVLAATDLPFVLLLLVGGAIADRFSRRAVAVVSEFTRAALLAAMAVLVLSPHFSAVTLAGLGATWGVARAFFAPTITGMTPEIFAEDALTSANGYREAARSFGNSGGPALGGLGVAIFSPAVALAFFALVYLVAAIWLTKMTYTPAGREVVSNSFVSDLRTGYREVRSQAWCFITIVIYSFMHLLVFGPLVVLGPAIMKSHHLGGAAAWGILGGVEGLGGIAGAALASRIKFKRPVWTSSIIALALTPALVLLAMAAPVAVMLPAFALEGMGFAFIGVNWETAMQRTFPLEAMSRVSAFDIFGSVALYPLGQVLGGAATAVISAQEGAAVAAVAMVVLSGVLLGSKSVYRLTSRSIALGETA
ncbi:MAG: MFS transporter [Actinomycetota bacterium]|nr:MFS transporter [Actinomycetota bacterium]MDA8396702.1 MFS transporter [Actinomycetota bacterium]